MNKKKFLSELEEKLNILDEKELNDTIAEYKDIIEEKVKDGKTEEEAVKEFGSMDELVEEILKAYKINPKKVNEPKENNGVEEFIKDSSKKLADASKNIYESFTQSNNELSLELIFEILIKFILLLIGFMILKLPFDLIEKLGHSILDFNIYPLDNVFKALWSILTGIGYLITCAVVFIAVFKPYFKSQSTKEIKKENIKEEKGKKKIKTKKNKEEEPILDFFKFIFRLFMIICVMVPLLFTDMGIIAALTVIVYYFFVGIHFIGLIILLAGILTGFIWFTDVCKQLTFGIKKIPVIPVIVAVVLTVFGSLLFASELLKIEYIDKEPKTHFRNAYIQKEFDIDDNTNNYFYSKDINYKVDNDIENGKIIVVANYKKGLCKNVDINLEKDESTYYINTHYDIEDGNINEMRYFYNLFINNLKKNKVYKYNDIETPNITIKANSETINRIK